MKKLLLCATLLVTTAGLASAGPGAINLGWTDCPGQGTYALTRTFACNSNTGLNEMVGSFVGGPELTAVTGFAMVIDVQTSGATLAPWWDLRASLPAGCRPASLLSSFDFTGGPFGCGDQWQGGATGGQSADVPIGNRVRLKATAALPSGDSRIGPVTEGAEMYCFKLRVNNARTLGGVCPGCNAEACIVLNSILLTQVPGTPGGNKTYSSPGTSAHVIWQAWTTVDPAQFCPLVTPAKNKTWGSIKAIYR
jgi:hypothetical protein